MTNENNSPEPCPDSSALLPQMSQLLELQKRQNAAMEDLYAKVQPTEQILKILRRTAKISEETLWAEIFNSAICDSSWLHNRGFCPGRWAAGYPFLYLLYRTLDELRPSRILELGLGQTTRMIAQYADANGSASHIVVEHDKKWGDFFLKNRTLPNNSELCYLPLSQSGVYKDDRQVVVYEGFRERFQDCQFDLIVIDGPFGFLAKQYSRVDVLEIMPECLADPFAILMDDSERPAEKRTISEMRALLDANGIPHKSGAYNGTKSTTIITSESTGFLCSL